MITLAAFGASPFISCTSGGSEDNESAASQAELQAESNNGTPSEGADDGASDDAEGNTSGAAKTAAPASAATKVADDDAANLPLPEKPTAWHTRTLVLTTPQPSTALVAACMEQVDHLANEATNQQEMATAPAQLLGHVEPEVAVYHFCFLQMMVRLDLRLDRGGALMTDQANSFFDGMRGLWLLSRTLDKVRGGQRYYDYLQARYIQLSRDYFGRDIVVVAPPLGHTSTRSKAGSGARPPGKPAKEIPSE